MKKRMLQIFSIALISTFVMSTSNHIDKDDITYPDICDDIAGDYITWYDNEYGFGGDVETALDLFIEVLFDCRNNWGLDEFDDL